MKPLFFFILCNHILPCFGQSAYTKESKIEQATVVLGQNKLKNGKYHFKRLGTGIICYIRAGKSGRFVPCIITAKHLIFIPHEGYIPGKIRIRFSKDEYKNADQKVGINILLATKEAFQLWFCPDDQQVDLACIALLPLEAVSAGLAIPGINALYLSSFPDSMKMILGEKVYNQDFLGKNAISGGKVYRLGLNSNRKNVFVEKNYLPVESGNLVFVPKSIFHKQIILVGMISSPWIQNSSANQANFLSNDSLHMVRTWSGYSQVEPEFLIHQLLVKASHLIGQFINLK